MGAREPGRARLSARRPRVGAAARAGLRLAAVTRARAALDAARVHGLVRIHASQEGNATWALLRLGLADERIDRLVDRLLRTQWPDGGWNCDPRATGTTSAFAESLLPLRALALHAVVTGSARSGEAARAAAEVFLRRRLHLRVRDGRPTHPQHLELHFPCYFHYDVLFGLKVMHEAGLLGDPRCCDALDLLESKRLPDGGWPAEGRFYGHAAAANRRSPVGWGGVSRRRANQWVTADAFDRPRRRRSAQRRPLSITRASTRS